MNLDEMIVYLKEAIQFNTASDIYELPRDEFTPYVKRCKDHIPLAVVPYAVLVLLIEEKNSNAYKVKKFFKGAK